jgi:hypothetical protein
MGQQNDPPFITKRTVKTHVRACGLAVKYKLLSKKMYFFGLILVTKYVRLISKEISGLDPFREFSTTRGILPQTS